MADNTMDIQQTRAARHEMEQAIQAAATEAVFVFREKTGLSPCQISIAMIDVTTFADSDKFYVVSGVKADVEL
jgi:hypothetical protein